MNERILASASTVVASTILAMLETRRAANLLDATEARTAARSAEDLQRDAFTHLAGVILLLGPESPAVKALDGVANGLQDMHDVASKGALAAAEDEDARAQVNDTIAEHASTIAKGLGRFVTEIHATVTSPG
jgi:hypothetical protein